MKFIQQAYKGNNKWTTYLGSILLLFFGWQVIGAIPIGIAAIYFGKDLDFLLKSSKDLLPESGMGGNLILFLMILTFAVGLATLFLCVKYIHRRKITTVLTSRKKLDWNRILYSFSIWFGITCIFTLLQIFGAEEDIIWNFKPIPFIVLCLISFLFLPLQTSMEEVLFRGYLMQGFGTWFKKPWIALLLTSTIFGLLHMANPEVEKLGMLIMIYYIGTGLVLGVMTLLDDGMELALGFHAANNIVAALLVTSSWSALQTDALWVDHSEPSLGWSTFLPVFILYPIVIFIFSKKFQWKSWREKLLKPVPPYPPIEVNEDELIAKS